MKRIFVFLLLPVIAFAEMGTPAARYQLPLEQPFGLALMQNNLLIADRATGRLYTFSIAEKRLTDSIPLPCDKPMGIAADADGLWISDKSNKRIQHFLPDKNRVDQVLAADLEALADEVYRVKGFVFSATGCVYIDLAAGATIRVIRTKSSAANVACVVTLELDRVA